MTCSLIIKSPGIKLTETMFVMAHSYLGQSISTIKDYQKRNILLISLYSWIICSTILSLCFKSVLLRTYFDRKPLLTVHTLDDLVSKPELFISGRISVNEMKYFRPDLFDKWKDKVDTYEKTLGINTGKGGRNMMNERLIKDVIDRKTVLLTNTVSVRMLKWIYSDSSLKESDYKYIAIYRYSYVHKDCPHREAIFKV